MRISKAFQVWFGAATLFGLLMFAYNYLDFVARHGLMSVRYLMEFPIDVILYTQFVWGVYLFDKLAAERAAQLESRLRQAQLRGCGCSSSRIFSSTR